MTAPPTMSDWRSRAAAAAVFIGLGLLALAMADDRPAPPVPKDFPRKVAAKVIAVVSPTVVRVQRGDNVEDIVLRGVTVAGAGESLARAEQFLQQLLIEESVYLDLAPSAESAAAGSTRSAFMYRVPDGLFVNLELVRQGYAAVRNESGNRHQKLMEDYERRARDARKGIWGADGRPGAPPKSAPVTADATPASQPATAASQPVAADAGVILVYVTPSGKKYHLSTCRHAQGAKSVSLAEAKTRQLAPCSVCKPPQ